MSRLKEFIEVTALSDGRKSLIRAESIIAVHDNGEEESAYGVKPSHRMIEYAGGEIDVRESIDEICGMIYNAEL